MSRTPCGGTTHIRQAEILFYLRCRRSWMLVGTAPARERYHNFVTAGAYGLILG